jgi:protein-S-isoprenylcysteine O-methyltransferase Ste14
MLPGVLWLVYAIPAYVLCTLAFRVRYGYSPVAERFPPRNLYEWMDTLLFVTLAGYSVWVVLDPRTDPSDALSTPAGTAVWAVGAALRGWAVYALGENWRIGQDDADQRAAFVITGPYRFIRHPINAALVLVAMGMLLMNGPDAPTSLLLAVSVAYYAVQGRAEDRRWRSRGEE